MLTLEQFYLMEQSMLRLVGVEIWYVLIIEALELVVLLLLNGGSTHHVVLSPHSVRNEEINYYTFVTKQVASLIKSGS